MSKEALIIALLVMPTTAEKLSKRRQTRPKGYTGKSIFCPRHQIRPYNTGRLWNQNYYQFSIFSIDYILSYMVRLIIVEKWLELDAKEGKKILDHLIKVAT